MLKLFFAMLALVSISGFSKVTCEDYFNPYEGNTVLRLEPMNLKNLSKLEFRRAVAELLYLAKQTAYPAYDKKQTYPEKHINIGKHIAPGYTLEFDYILDERNPSQRVYVLTTVILVGPDMVKDVLEKRPLARRTTDFAKNEIDMNVNIAGMRVTEVRVPTVIDGAMQKQVSNYYRKLKYVKLDKIKPIMKNGQFWMIDKFYAYQTFKDFFIGDYVKSVAKSGFSFIVERVGVGLLIVVLGSAAISFGIKETKKEIGNQVTIQLQDPTHKGKLRFLTLEYLEKLGREVSTFSKSLQLEKQDLKKELQQLELDVAAQAYKVKLDMADASHMDNLLYGKSGEKFNFLLTLKASDLFAMNAEAGPSKVDTYIIRDIETGEISLAFPHAETTYRDMAFVFKIDSKLFPSVYKFLKAKTESYELEARARLIDEFPAAASE